MKYRLKYSQDVADKLRGIRSRLRSTYGEVISNRALSVLMKEIRSLQINPQKGPTVETILGVASPYRFIHVGPNIVFYRVQKDTVYIVELFHEKEDFLRKMFGISLRTQESIDFWGD